MDKVKRGLIQLLSSSLPIKYQPIAVKCPYCSESIKVKEGKIPGGVNDRGGWIIKCSGCSKEFPISIKNPDDYSIIISGGTIIETWDEDIISKKDFLKKMKVKDIKVEALMYPEYEELEPISFDFTSPPIYLSKEGEDLEKPAYNALKKVMSKWDSRGFTEIKRHNYQYFNAYLKGGWGEPKYVYIILSFNDTKGQTHDAVFYYNFDVKGEIPNDPYHYLLLEVTNRIEFDSHINGIYTRNECKQILDKFLIRWRGLYSYTVIAVPFIGYQKQKHINREKIWTWLRKFTIEENVLFFTRKIALSLREDSLKNQGVPVEILKEYEITEKGIDSAKIENFFHAKFYIGIGKENSEILKGSYNLHENNYLENFDCQTLPTRFIIERYLKRFNIDTTNFKFENKDAFVIDLRKPGSEIEFECLNGQEIIKKYL